MLYTAGSIGPKQVREINGSTRRGRAIYIKPEGIRAIAIRIKSERQETFNHTLNVTQFKSLSTGKWWRLAGQSVEVL